MYLTFNSIRLIYKNTTVAAVLFPTKTNKRMHWNLVDFKHISKIENFVQVKYLPVLHSSVI